MQPNLEGIVSQGFRISWKYKILWVPNILFWVVILIVVIPFLPFILSPFAGIDGGPTVDVNWQLYIGFWILFIAVSALLESIANSCTIVGILHAEAGNKVSLGELADEGYKYIGRVIGIILLFRFSTLGVIVTFFYLFSSLPNLMSLLCFPALFLVLIAYLFLNILIEQVKVSIVIADINVTGAIRYAFRIFSKNFGLLFMIFLIIGLVGFAISNILGVVVALTNSITPLFLLLSHRFERSGLDYRIVTIVSGIISLPLSTIIEGAFMAFEKSLLTTAYLQLMHSSAEKANLQLVA